MASLIIVIGIMLFTTFVISLIALSTWLYLDRFWRTPNFIKGFIFMKSGGLRIIWLRKSDKRDKQKTANNPNYGDFVYFEKDLFNFKHYTAAFFSEENITSVEVGLNKSKPEIVNLKKFISVDMEKARAELNLMTNLSLHPKTLNDVLDAKLLAELTAKDMDVKTIVIILGIILIIIGLVFVYLDIESVKKGVEGVQHNISMIGNIIQNMNIKIR